MKSRDALVRLKTFRAGDRRRRAAQLEAMVSEFARMMKELDREIAAEEQRTNNADPSHYAYSTYARSIRIRRDNLGNSASELRVQLDDARRVLDEAVAELDTVQQLEEGDKAPSHLRRMGAGSMARAASR